MSDPPASTPAATVPAPAPPEKTDWTLVVISGVAVSVITTLLWMGVEHAHKAVKKTNRELSHKKR